MEQKISNIFFALMLFVPISFFFALFTQDKLMIFTTSSIALIPIARVIGYATKEIALQTNPTIGGLVNATFGNIMELIIAVFALSQGLVRIVQASLIGSIIGNILLLIGLSVFFGGLKYKEQRFNQNSAGVSSTMLIIAVVGLALPSIYSMVNPDSQHVALISDAVVAVFAITYIANLVFSLYTHKHLFAPSDEIKSSKEKPTMKKRHAIAILIIATIFVTFEADLMVSQVEFAANAIGLSQTFIGLVIVAVLTNVAEKANAIHFARENKLDISLEIGLNSAIQIALFVVPIIMLISEIMGYGFAIQFSLFEIISVFFSVMIINYLSSDGKCNWLEGFQLISVYLIIAIAFFFT